MTTTINPMSYFKDKAPSKRRRKRKAIAYTETRAMGHDEAHIQARRTTANSEREVRVEASILARGWHVTAFLEDETGRSEGAGIWLVFSEDTKFRAGEGLWLTPQKVLWLPQIERI